MFRTFSLAGAVVALCLTGSGCVVSGQVRGGAYVEEEEPPDMVAIQPGVYVFADYSQPVFYNSGYYWLYRDGYWLRSYSYTGGWARVRTVPYGVRRIHRPYAYVRYRPSGRVNYYRAGRGGRVYRSAPRARTYDRRNNRYDRRQDRRDYRRQPAARDHRSRDHRTRDDRRRAAPPSRDHRTDKRRKSRDRDDDDDRKDRRRR